MSISLYTSRVVLTMLGVNDFGVYSVVGGIISILGVFNAAMSSATQRFLSFDMGFHDSEKLKKTFNTTIVIHSFVGVFFLILAETVGLWYINNKLQFSRDRSLALNIMYQITIAIFIIKVFVVPYNALVIARERMKIYAYMSILEALLSLLSAYILVFFQYDKLILYSLLNLLAILITSLSYIIYCNIHFPESKISFNFDALTFSTILQYSSWSLFGNIAAAAKVQGVNIVLNAFFGPIVNAAYGITLQVQNAITLLFSNLQTAANPQIVKSYAQNDLQNVEYLILQTSKISFFLLLLVVCPLAVNIEAILRYWLNSPPPLAAAFINLTLISVLIDCISGPIIIGIQASGKIKLYQIVLGVLNFLTLPISYLLFFVKPINPQKVFMIVIIISLVALILRLFFMQLTLGINAMKFAKSLFFRIFAVLVPILLLVYVIRSFSFVQENYIFVITTSILIILLTIYSIWFLGLSTSERIVLRTYIVKLVRRW